VEGVLESVGQITQNLCKELDSDIQRGQLHKNDRDPGRNHVLKTNSGGGQHPNRTWSEGNTAPEKSPFHEPFHRQFEILVGHKTWEPRENVMQILPLINRARLTPHAL
jgi:hypothetical protein